MSMFAPSGVKTVQRGTITFGGNTQQGTATITAVVTAKSAIVLTGFSLGDAGTFSTTANVLGSFYPRLSLTNTTTVTADTENLQNFTTALKVNFCVTEYL